MNASKKWEYKWWIRMVWYHSSYLGFSTGILKYEWYGCSSGDDDDDDASHWFQYYLFVCFWISFFRKPAELKIIQNEIKNDKRNGKNNEDDKKECEQRTVLTNNWMLLNRQYLYLSLSARTFVRLNWKYVDNCAAGEIAIYAHFK